MKYMKILLPCIELNYLERQMEVWKGEKGRSNKNHPEREREIDWMQVRGVGAHLPAYSCTCLLERLLPFWTLGRLVCASLHSCFCVLFIYLFACFTPTTLFVLRCLSLLSPYASPLPCVPPVLIPSQAGRA